MKYPHGGRCMDCLRLVDDCTHIPFDRCKAISKPDKDGDVAVACPEFIKNHNTWRIFL